MASRPTSWSIDSPEVSIQQPKSCSRKVFSSHQLDNLMELYTKLYSVSRSAITLSNTYLQYSSITLNGKILGSFKGMYASSSIVIANWNYALFGGSFSSDDVPKTAKIEFFCQHNIMSRGERKSNFLVSLLWFKPHPKNTTFGKPLSVWYYDLFELGGIYDVVPLHFIKCRAISLIDKLYGESVLYSCPCIEF